MGDLAKVFKQHIIVLGDAMLDRYILGKVSRVSPEAPIPVVNHEKDRDVLGGAANVVRNVCDFGARATLLSVIGGESEEAQAFMQCLGRHDCAQGGLVVDGGRPTTSKTRVIGNGQQIVRIDKEVDLPISGAVERDVVERLRACFTGGDSLSEGDDHAQDGRATIVADYAKGVVTPLVVEELRWLASQGVIVAVDPHPKNRQDWRGVTVFKPNLSEIVNITGVRVELIKGEDPRENESLREAISVLYERYEVPHLLITLSEHGMVYVYKNTEFHWEPTRAQEVFDVSGAGDTVISYFTLALSAGWSGVEATRLANMAAGLVVQKLGTASLSYEEVEREWGRMKNEE